MSLIAWFTQSVLGKFLLDFVWGKLLSLAADVIKKFKKDQEINKEAKDSVEPLKKATTAQEIDDAADSTLNGL